MDLVSLLKNSTLSYNTSSGSIVNIKTGDGNNNVNISAGIVSLNTGSKGVDNVVINANSADINTNASDDTIIFTGNQFDISALGGNNDIQVKGNLNNTTAKNTIKVGDGTESSIRVIANNVDVEAGDTNLDLGFYGNNYGITAGDGSHDIGFWGNNVDIDLAKGNNEIQTLDLALKNGDYNDFGFENLVQSLVSTKSEVVGTSTSVEIQNNAIDQIAKKYNLSAKEKSILSSVDLNAKAADGKPLYVLEVSPKKTKANGGKLVYVVVKRDWNNDTHGRAVSDNECIRCNTLSSETYTETEVTTTEISNKITTTIAGVKNVTISNEEGHNDIAMTLQTAFDPSNLANAATDNIMIQKSNVQTTIQKTSTEQDKDKTLAVAVGDTNAWNSPLIVDFNKDGKVSAAAGEGVDIDNNGKADGAATGGDKMLAMTDMNGNGSIDGSEVFGDQTVSPFTGKKLNATNGFEALKMIAEQAEQYTGVKCMTDGNVDLAALKQALQKVGVNLGFISDNNTTELEDLGHVASINVSNYEESNREDGQDVQNRQLGSYTDVTGEKYNVNDVWFTLA